MQPGHCHVSAVPSAITGAQLPTYSAILSKSCTHSVPSDCELGEAYCKVAGCNGRCITVPNTSQLLRTTTYPNENADLADWSVLSSTSQSTQQCLPESKTELNYLWDEINLKIQLWIKNYEKNTRGKLQNIIFFGCIRKKSHQ